MTEFKLSTNSDLAGEPFLKSLQNREMHPVNNVTHTDFILEGGITIALRKSEYGMVLKVMKYPLQISIAVPHANERLLQQNGQATIREILAASIKSHRSKRARLVVDDNPPEGLIDVIFGCLYLAADHSNPKRPWRTSVYAPSSIQTAGFSTMLFEPGSGRDEQLRSAFDPLLSLIPEAATDLVSAESLGAHSWARGHDYAVVPQKFDRTITSENALGAVARMKLMRDMLSEIPKFGVDPLPIVETFTG